MNIAYYEMNLFHDLPMNILLIEHLIMVFRSEVTEDGAQFPQSLSMLNLKN